MPARRPSTPPWRRGSRPEPRLQDVGSKADIVFISLPTPDIVNKVVLGEQGSPRVARQDGRRSVDHGPRHGGAGLEGPREHGIAWVDAPVSGGIAGAKGGTLAVMASGPKAAYATGGAAAQEFRQAVLRRREGRARAGRQARQQSPGGLGPGHHLRSRGDGRKGRSRPQGADRHHQRLQRPQQRQPGQVPPRGAAAHLRLRLRHRACPTRTCACASTRRRPWACPWWRAPRCGRCWPSRRPSSAPTSDFTSIAKVVEEWAGVEIKG